MRSQSRDYAFGGGFAAEDHRKIHGRTFEFGREFVPSYEEMQKIIKDVCTVMTGLCWSVCPEA